MTIHAKELLICFGGLFPDSKIAASMELSKNKLKYINHGHTPYFKNILTEDLGSADFLPVCFDESINKTTQNCVMDLVLRYWDNIKKKKTAKV